METKYPRVIAHVKAKTGDPDAAPMTLTEAVQAIKDDHERMLRDLDEQLRAYFDRQQGATEH